MNDWRHKALLFSDEIGSFFEYSNSDEVLSKSLQVLCMHIDCQQLLLVKQLDPLSEKIVHAYPCDNCRESLVDTRQIEKTPIGNLWVSQSFSDRHLPFLESCQQIIGIPIALDFYAGSILLLWNNTFEPEESFLFFLESCANKIRELLSLTYAYRYLNQFKARFNSILYNIPHGIVFIDENSTEVLINASAKALLSIDQQQNHFAPELIAERMKSFRESATNQEEVNEVAKALFEDPDRAIHKWLWVFEEKALNVNSIPIESEHHKGRLWVFEDISNFYFNNIKLSKLNNHLSNVKLEIEGTNRKLKALNEDKNNVISILSHDLRSPLNKISSLIELIEVEKATLTDKQLQCLQFMKQVTTEGLELITDILDINTLENQSLQLNICTFDLADLLHSQIQNFQSIAVKKEISITYEGAASLMLESDKSKLNRIIENLLSNAIKFSPRNSEILIEGAIMNNQIHFSVKNEGKGIPEREMTFLFQKYKKLSTRPTAGESSSGLGLSIVKVLVDSLNGQIQCTSVVNQSTVFKVTLPAQQ